MNSTSLHDLKLLVLSFHPIVVIETVEEDRVGALLDAVAGELSMAHFNWSINRGLERVPGDEPIATQWTTDPLQLLSHIQAMTIESLYHLRDFGRHLDTPQVVRQLRDLAKAFSATRSTLILTGRRIELPDEVAHHAVPYELQLPGRDELRPVLRSVLRSLGERRPVPVQMDDAGMDRFLDALSGLTVNQARQAMARAVLEDGRLDTEDIVAALARKAETLRQDGLLEYRPAEDNSFQLGGFGRLKGWLERARVGFSEQARELNLAPPKGILLVGVQGCGKSLAAKCIAREWRLPLLKLDAGRLYDKYVGESEKNLRRAIEVAESMAPSLLWIDEIEKAFAPTREGGGDGGVSQRIFATLLSWLQEKRAEVFVVATANDVFSLPPELLRKGRFDELFFVDLPDLQEREAIFRIHLLHRKQEPERFDLMALVEASAGMSGAEIEQGVIGALYRALHARQTLDTALLLEEIRETVPLSITRREDLERLRSLARERFVPVR